MEIVFLQVAIDDYPKDFVILLLLLEGEAGASWVQPVHESLDPIADDEIADVVSEIVLVGIELFDAFLGMLGLKSL